MQSAFLVSATLFSAFSAAQNYGSFNINGPLESRVNTDVSNFATTLAANPDFQKDLSAIATAIPSSVLAQANANPDALANQLNTATALPSWVSAIPTPVANSLNTLLAKPINADVDVNSYLGALVTQPSVSSVLSVLATAVPASLKGYVQTDPVDFLGDLVVATALPTWASALPASVQSQLGSVINQGYSIIATDFEATGKVIAKGPVPTSRASSYSGRPSFATGNSSRSFFLTASGTGPKPTLAGVPTTCPTCPACTPVTIYSTVTASPVPPSSASNKQTTTSSNNTTPLSRPSSGLSFSRPANSTAPFSSKPTTPSTTPTTKPTTLPTAPTPTVSKPSSALQASSGLPKTTASGALKAFNGSTAATSPLAFKGAAVPMRTAATPLVLLLGVATALLV
ncbi:hypothetical protein MMC28_007708 [Mycoblastus sanguinarius]|nr:hypothetical protein [Mycoblastus sanguinarius]